MAIRLPFPQPRPLAFFVAGFCGWTATGLVTLPRVDGKGMELSVGAVVLAFLVVLLVESAGEGTHRSEQPRLQTRWVLPVLALGGLVSLPFAGTALLLGDSLQAPWSYAPVLVAGATVLAAVLAPLLRVGGFLLPLWERLLGRATMAEVEQAIAATVARHRFHMLGENTDGFCVVVTEYTDAAVPLPTWLVGTASPSHRSLDGKAGSEAWVGFMHARLAKDIDAVSGWRLPPHGAALVTFDPMTAHERLAILARSG